MSIYDTPEHDVVNEESLELLSQETARRGWITVTAVAYGIAHFMVLSTNLSFDWLSITLLFVSTLIGVFISFFPVGSSYIAKFGRALSLSVAHVISLSIWLKADFFTFIMWILMGYSIIITICMVIAYVLDKNMEKRQANWWMAPSEETSSVPRKENSENSEK